MLEDLFSSGKIPLAGWDEAMTEMETALGKISNQIDKSTDDEKKKKLIEVSCILFRYILQSMFN